MARKPKISDADRALFQSTVGPVRRQKYDKVDPVSRRPAPVPRQRHMDEENVMHEAMSGWFDPATIETGEELLYSRPGLQHSAMRKLRRGQYSVEAELDLHGFTVPEARQALGHFLQDCQNNAIHCVRIIHGKGSGSKGKLPVLKGMVNNWLRRVNAVMGFTSARPVDGGTGAIYVLLKKRR